MGSIWTARPARSTGLEPSRTSTTQPGVHAWPSTILTPWLPSARPCKPLAPERMRRQRSLPLPQHPSLLLLATRVPVVLSAPIVGTRVTKLRFAQSPTLNSGQYLPAWSVTTPGTILTTAPISPPTRKFSQGVSMGSLSKEVVKTTVNTLHLRTGRPAVRSKKFF